MERGREKWVDAGKRERALRGWRGKLFKQGGELVPAVRQFAMAKEAARKKRVKSGAEGLSRKEYRAYQEIAPQACKARAVKKAPWAKQRGPKKARGPPPVKPLAVAAALRHFKRTGSVPECVTLENLLEARVRGEVSSDSKTYRKLMHILLMRSNKDIQNPGPCIYSDMDMYPTVTKCRGGYILECTSAGCPVHLFMRQRPRVFLWHHPVADDACASSAKTAFTPAVVKKYKSTVGSSASSEPSLTRNEEKNKESDDDTNSTVSSSAGAEETLAPAAPITSQESATVHKKCLDAMSTLGAAANEVVDGDTTFHPAHAEVKGKDPGKSEKDKKEKVERDLLDGVRLTPLEARDLMASLGAVHKTATIKYKVHTWGVGHENRLVSNRNVPQEAAPIVIGCLKATIHGPAHWLAVVLAYVFVGLSTAVCLGLWLRSGLWAIGGFSFPSCFRALPTAKCAVISCVLSLACIGVVYFATRRRKTDTLRLYYVPHLASDVVLTFDGVHVPDLSLINQRMSRDPCLPVKDRFAFELMNGTLKVIEFLCRRRFLFRTPLPLPRGVAAPP